MGDVLYRGRGEATLCAAALCAASLCVLGAAGCGMITEVARMPTPSARRAELRETEARMRDRFTSEGDTKAIRWLLAHRVEEGMPLEEVNQILGLDGEFVEADHFLKRGRSGYHVDDATYRWGPDDHGKTYFLIFRERKLVNFDPAQFGRERD